MSYVNTVKGRKVATGVKSNVLGQLGTYFFWIKSSTEAGPPIPCIVSRGLDMSFQSTDSVPYAAFSIERLKH